MPKRTDIKNILVIGSGPITIGQACEFDYSGTQACVALREEGYRVVLINSNPASVMTHPDIADSTYLEPLCLDIIEKILVEEKIDALLPTLGGQTALNVTRDLYQKGIFEKHGVKVLGAHPDVIERAENRSVFQELLKEIGLSYPRGEVVSSLEEAEGLLTSFPFPLVIRPSFTLGGLGGGIAHNLDQFKTLIQEGFSFSPSHSVLVEESVFGWKEYELEVVRDHKDNCIVVCSLENVDPMGVHTGDSITVAPALTLTDKEYQNLREASFRVLRAVGVETGGSNVQFAVNPKDGRVIVIEMNPRVSRSSALASKATGFPIARVAAKLAVGYSLDEIPNDITRTSCAAFEPSIDYVVTKIPRFDFEKFKGVTDHLTTSMQSVGEVMALGSSFQESLQKGIRSLEKGYTGLDCPFQDQNIDEFLEKGLGSPSSQTLFYIAEAFRRLWSLEKVQKLTFWDPWFLRQIEGLISVEKDLIKIDSDSEKLDQGLLRTVKSMGFSNEKISELTAIPLQKIELKLQKYNIFPVYRRVDTCAGEFHSPTPYLYSSYLPNISSVNSCEADPSEREKVIIIGSGPNHIGQGIEFDYCCVQAAKAAKDMGYESILINSNPETVSTDHTVSDKLYFSPLEEEEVLSILGRESQKGQIKGVFVQFGGQTSLKLAEAIQSQGYTLLGTSRETIDLCEDRGLCHDLLKKKGFHQPPSALCTNDLELEKAVLDLGYPVILRPSYVIGGKNMIIARTKEDLEGLSLFSSRKKTSILVESYLDNATEFDVDALYAKGQLFVIGILQHVEKAGVHSGDSHCMWPSPDLTPERREEIVSQTHIICEALKIQGPINVQFALQGDRLYILEINPRASRTLPFMEKARKIPAAYMAAQVSLGDVTKPFQSKVRSRKNYFALKAPVFSFHKLPGVDPLLGPEMRSTGEAMYQGKTPYEALTKWILDPFSFKGLPEKKVLIICEDETQDTDELKESFAVLGISSDIYSLKKYREDFSKQSEIKEYGALFSLLPFRIYPKKLRRALQKQQTFLVSPEMTKRWLKAQPPTK